MSPGMRTIRVLSEPYDGYDNCLRAAEKDYISSHPDMDGWSLSPRWEDDRNRAYILLDVLDDGDADCEVVS